MKEYKTVWDLLKAAGYMVVPRDEKHTTMFVLESDKMNAKQKASLVGRQVFMGEKLDGVYSLVVVCWVDGILTVRHFGRSGKAQCNTEALDELVRSGLCARYSRGDMPVGVHISEVTSDSPLAVLSGYLTPTRVNEAEEIPVNVQDNFYDFITLSGFCEGIYQKEAWARYEYERVFMGRIGLPIIHHERLLYEKAVENAQWLISQGREGGVIKQCFGTWEAGKRDVRQVKVKERIEKEVRVVGMCSGKAGTKYEHTLGKLLVFFRAHGKEDGAPLLIPISGMTDAQRKLWWEHPERIVGKVVKMAAKSYTAPGNLREPRFKEVREDKQWGDYPVAVDYTSAPEVFTKAQCVWKQWPTGPAY